MTNLNRIGLITVIFFFAGLQLFCGYAVNAQDEASGDEESGNQAVEEEQSAVQEGIAKGVYWWADIDPAAIASFTDFGVDVVAIRYGELGVAGDPQRFPAPSLEWRTSSEPEIIASLAPSLRYRLVIDTDSSVWRTPGLYNRSIWLAGALAPALQQTNITIDSIEIRLPSGTGAGPDPATLAAFLDEISTTDFGVPVVTGVNAAYFGTISPADLEAMASAVTGLVVYFTDYDYFSITPQITSRAWIDGTSAELERLGIPFTAVFPVYNRAIAFTDSGGGVVLGAVDILTLRDMSDIREMGTAGTEFVINQQVDLPTGMLDVGDRVRVLKSLSEIDLEALLDEFPNIAPNCGEIDLFRFPMVPHFDPSASEVLAEAGWMGSTAIQEEISPEDAEKEELDAKHNQTQQIIMIVTLGLMMVVMMRMFSKGGAKQGGDAGGK